VTDKEKRTAERVGYRSDYARPIDPESDGVWRASLVAIHRRIYASSFHARARIGLAVRSITINNDRAPAKRKGREILRVDPGLCLIIVARRSID